MRISQAIAAVDRRLFLPDKYRNTPDIEDVAVPFGENQTVPTARITEFFIRLADLNSESVVLEIGTGSGYQAAILARLVKEVHTVEVRRGDPDLPGRLPRNVVCYHQDGTHDIPDGPYDAILVTCAVPGPYLWWRNALKDGGVIVLPRKSTAEIVKYVKENGLLDDLGPYAFADFVPVQSTLENAGICPESTTVCEG